VEADAIRPVDERRHPPGPGRDWEESWYLDFAAADGTLAGYVRLALRPGEGTAWFWAGMVGGGPPAVVVRDHDVAPPTGAALEVRAPGLWTELVCETPLDHWSVGLEAFGVALDDPEEAWRSERGDPWALGLDVEWEGLSACVALAGGGGYRQACAVHGDVLVGAARFDLDGSGVRIHAWGRRNWPWSPPWAAGRLDDGTSFFADIDVGVGVDRVVTADGLVLRMSPVAPAPVQIPSPGGAVTRLSRALCRYDADDGRSGYGWAEWPVT